MFAHNIIMGYIMIHQRKVGLHFVVSTAGGLLVLVYPQQSGDVLHSLVVGRSTENIRRQRRAAHYIEQPYVGLLVTLLVKAVVYSVLRVKAGRSHRLKYHLHWHGCRVRVPADIQHSKTAARRAAGYGHLVDVIPLVFLPRPPHEEHFL